MRNPYADSGACGPRVLRCDLTTEKTQIGCFSFQVKIGVHLGQLDGSDKGIAFRSRLFDVDQRVFSGTRVDPKAIGARSRAPLY